MSWFLPEYGPAVAGLGAISGRLLAGLIGAAEMPACDLPVVSALDRVDAAAAVGAAVAEDDIDTLEEPDTVRTGVTVAIAEPGRAGRVLVAIALFWAIIASLNEGLGPVPIVLLDKPKPGRATGSDFAIAVEFGLFGSFCSSFWAVESSPSMILRQSLVNGIFENMYSVLTFQLTPARWPQRPNMCYAFVLSHQGLHRLGLS